MAKRKQAGKKKTARGGALSDAMGKALNGQINEELFSGYLYLSMSACFAAKSLNGIASWFRAQALEEQIHASKIFDFILERGGQVQLDAIKKPQISWDSPLEAFQAALAHEQHITECINDLVGQAEEHKDYASKVFLDWFVNEQVEEEDTAQGIVDQLELIGDNGYGLLMLDRELGQRAFVMPPADGEAGA
ncbi:MAG: ferritin [Phycisphaerae bacterium]